MRFLKTYKIMKYLKRFNENISADDLVSDIKNILIDIEDAGHIKVGTSLIRKDVYILNKEVTLKYLEVTLFIPWGSPYRHIQGAPEPPGGKYPGDIFLWKEIKEPIIQLVEWYYSITNFNDDIRFFNSGIEFGKGWKNEKQLNNLGDLISFTTFRMLIRVE